MQYEENTFPHIIIIIRINRSESIYKVNLTTCLNNASLLIASEGDLRFILQQFHFRDP